MGFMNLLCARWEAGCHVCVGLDPLVEKIPPFLTDGGNRSLDEALLTQLTGVIDATKDVACAFKPNFGFYSSLPYFIGPRVLAAVIKHIHLHATGVPVLLDGKWGDIGASSERYAAAAFDQNLFGADAATVNPYLGGGAISPFMETKTKGDDGIEKVSPRDTGVLVICRTSNLDAAEIQDHNLALPREALLRAGLTDIDIDKFVQAGCIHQFVYGSVDLNALYLVPVYIWTAILVSRQWNKYKNCGLVVGATVPEQLRRVRIVVGDDMPLLLPGFGKQGAKIHEVVPAGINSRGSGLLYNNSSGILFASSGQDFAAAAAVVVVDMNNQIKTEIAGARRFGG